MAYAVLARGFVGGALTDASALDKGDLRARLPRFQPGNIEKNLELRAALEAVARRKNATLAQLSIAWVIARGEREGVFIAAIPGAKRRVHVEENLAAADLRLTDEDMAELDLVAPPGAAAGSRYPEGQMRRLNV